MGSHQPIEQALQSKEHRHAESYRISALVEEDTNYSRPTTTVKPTDDETEPIPRASKPQRGAGKCWKGGE